MPIEAPTGPGGADRGKIPVPGDPCYLCEVVGGRSDKGIVEETDMTLTLVNWTQFELGQVYVIPGVTPPLCSTSRTRRPPP